MRTIAVIAALAAAVAPGCSQNTHIAEADRALTADHVANSAVMVDSRNGSIELTVDPSASGVSIKAHVRAAAATPDAANERLAQVVVNVRRDAAGALVIDSTFPPPQSGNDGVSYTIILPDASRAEFRSSNGRLTARGVDGPVVLHTSNGAITAERIGGAIEARSSNGGISLVDGKAGADVETSNGTVSMQSVRGPIKAGSSNGRLELRDVGGPVDASTSNGSVTLSLASDFPGTLEVSTSNGGVEVVGSPAVSSVKVGRHDATVVFKTPGEKSSVRSSNGSVRVDVK